MLPAIPYPTATTRRAQTAFGGLDRRAGALNGAIRGMTNLWSGDAPLVASRPARYVGGTISAPHGLFFNGGDLFTVSGTTLYVNGVSKGTVTDTDKVFAAMGNRVLIFPDKLLYDGTLHNLESSHTESCTFTDGTYAGETAEGNTIQAASLLLDWGDYFSVGDAVTITGAADEENNKTIIVREIDGNKLRFYENSFTVNSTAASITVKRAVPDLDCICVNENRAWGCKGDTIYASKLGDPYNWNVFDGLDTDAWSVESGTAGSFTACVSFLGYPVFFKRESVMKVYGSRPTNFELMSSATLGAVNAKSIAVTKETLYYLSRAGFVAYSGGIPAPIDAALNAKYTSAVAGSDGLKYYASATDGTSTELLVYDPAVGAWHREDTLAAHSMASHGGGVYCLGTDGKLTAWGTAPAGYTQENAVESMVEFSDWDYGSFQGKYPVRLWLRAESSAALTVYIRYNGGEWESAGAWTPTGKEVCYMPLPIRRCDHFALKISAAGAWKLYALELQYFAGKTSRKG